MARSRQVHLDMIGHQASLGCILLLQLLPKLLHELGITSQRHGAFVLADPLSGSGLSGLSTGGDVESGSVGPELLFLRSDCSRLIHCGVALVVPCGTSSYCARLVFG